VARIPIFARTFVPLALLPALMVAGAALPAGAAPVTGTSGPRPRGVDVSRWQSPGSTATTCRSADVGWGSVRFSGRSFVVIRATSSSTGRFSTDPCFQENWDRAEAAGLYRGAYHYARPSRVPGSAARDAVRFVSVTGRMQDPGDLPPVLDLETTGGLTPGQVSDWASTWLRTVRSRTGRVPMIYTSPSFWASQVGGSRRFGSYPLWIAHWGVRSPRVPDGWRTWTLWQHSATGRVPGITGDVDLDLFNGSAWRLRRFAHPRSYFTTSTSGAVAVRGSRWWIGGHLRSSGQALADRRAYLYRRSAGSAAWRAVGSTRTTGTGAFRFVLRPTAAADYRVRFSGDAAVAASWSSWRGHTVRDRYPRRPATARTVRGGVR
jgi:GH25 family lysozyme M1 (1,4-beta-N-acetylmuramidase)